MLVLSSPSGAGKTTLSRRLLERTSGIEMSVSVTTRRPRPGEVEGQDYCFRDTKAFERMRDGGELLEWAAVFDHFYGTPRAPVESALTSGRDVLFDIDWQGARQLRDRCGDDLASIFILPPSAASLEQRLHSRAQDSADVVARRMAKAGEEIRHWGEYDYVVVNTEIEQALTEIDAILTAERHKRERRAGLVDFVATLIEGLSGERRD